MTAGIQRPDLSIDQHLALRTAAVRLYDSFSDVFGVETIERFLHSSYDEFAARAVVVNYLPLLAERFARQRLKALAKVEGRTGSGVPTVLFLCTHNAGRSQMAMGACSPTWRATGRLPGPAAPSPASTSTPPRSRRWPRWASTSPGSTRSRGPTRSSARPTP